MFIKSKGVEVNGKDGKVNERDERESSMMESW